MLSLERALLAWQSFQKHRPVDIFVSKMIRTTVSCPKTNPSEFKWKYGKNNIRKYSLLRLTEFFVEELNNSMNNRNIFSIKKKHLRALQFLSQRLRGIGENTSSPKATTLYI